VEIAGSFSHRVRLEYYDCRLSRTTRSVAVEVLIQLAPELPQPFTILAHGSPREHIAPGPGRTRRQRVADPSAPTYLPSP
jgi:hypothetical protein